MNRVVRLLAAIVAALLLTAGCSMIPGLGSQSGIQACSAISGTVQGAATKLTSALTQAASDPQAASAAVSEFVNSLASARSTVTNADVGAALDKATTAGQKLIDLLSKAGASGLDPNQVTKLTADVQSALTELVTACTKI